jgi:outer membrane receptor protein involved in Fe transport
MRTLLPMRAPIYCERLGLEFIRQVRLWSRSAQNSLFGFEHAPRAKTAHGGKTWLLSVRRTARTALVGIALLSTSATALADARTEARAHFKKGMSGISSGKYEQGIDELKKAYEVLPHPNVLFNIARAYVEMGDIENAIQYYKQYVGENPPDKEDVQSIIGQLQGRLDRQRAALAASQLAAPTPATVTPGGATALPSTGAGDPNQPAGSLPGVAPGGSSPPAASALPAGEPLIAGAQRVEEIYEESVVTASRGAAQSPLESPNSTTIISEQDIRLSGITKIPALLRRVAGADVMETTSGFTETSVRGFNQRFSNKLLVLIDGRSVFVDYFGGTLWESFSIDVDQIERIEVVRGPGSALYGADAFAGVVNIITKAPGTGKNGVRAGVGDNLATYGSVRATGRDGSFSYRVSAGYTRNPRWSREFQDNRNDLKIEGLGKSNFGSQWSRLDIRTTQRIGKDIVFGLGGGAAMGSLDLYSVGAFKNWGFTGGRAGDLTAFLNTQKLNTRVFYNFTNFGRLGGNVDYIGQDQQGTSFASNIVDVESVYADKFETGSVTNSVNIGINYRLRTGDAAFTSGFRSENHYGIFAQDTIALGKAASVMLSGRVDRVPYTSNFEASPRVSLLFHPNERSTIRGSFSTAFRKPTIQEGYTFIPVQAPQGSISSAVDTLKLGRVRPERILTAEIGYLNQMSDFFDIDVAAYFNRVTDLVTVAPATFVTPSDRVTGYSDLDLARGRYVAQFGGFVNQCVDFNVFGGEVGVKAYPIQGFDFFANYALNAVSAIRPPGCDLPADRRTSAHKINLGAQVRSKTGIDGEVVFNYVSDQRWVERDLDVKQGTLVYRDLPLSGYALLNARVGYRFPGNKAEVSATAFNLLGNVHQEHPYTQFVGRRIMGFFQYSF